MIEEVINVKMLRTTALLICGGIIAFVLVRGTGGPTTGAVAQKAEQIKPIIKLEVPAVDSAPAALPPAGEVAVPQTTQAIQTKPGVSPPPPSKKGTAT